MARIANLVKNPYIGGKSVVSKKKSDASKKAWKKRKRLYGKSGVSNPKKKSRGKGKGKVKKSGGRRKNSTSNPPTPTKRKINGSTYTFSGIIHGTKKAAADKAKSVRSGGRKARVNKLTKGYAVYIGPAPRKRGRKKKVANPGKKTGKKGGKRKNPKTKAKKRSYKKKKGG
ncbi:MAG: hypothetical protein ACTSRU_15075, partial [Candidatus Hodarchaeales archaeon]